MDTLRFGLYLLGIAVIIALAVVIARAGSSPPVQHEVIFIASDQTFNNIDNPGHIYSCTRSDGAPPCPLGENSAQAVADLLNAGFTAYSTLQPLNEFGVVMVR